jgi:hypothetical protein
VPITFVQKAEGVAPSAASIVLAFTNPVNANSVVTIEAARYTAATTDAFVVGDLTKTAGTATIGTIVLDVSAIQDVEDVTDKENSGIWRVNVTGSGTLTFTLTGNAGDYFWMNVTEWSDMDNVCMGAISAIGNSAAADSGTLLLNQPGMLLAALALNSVISVTLTEDAAFTLLNEEENGVANTVGASAYRLTQGAVSDSGSWTLGSAEGWACCLALYRDAPTPVNSLFVPLVAA